MFAEKLRHLTFLKRPKTEKHSSDVADLTRGLLVSIEHDVKGPLQIINNEVAALEHDFQSNAKIVRRLERIRSEVARIFSVMETIQLVRVETQSYDCIMVKTELRHLVERSIRALKDEIAPMNPRFRTDGGPLYCKCFPPMLQRAIVTALRLAVQSTPEFETPTVAIHWESQRTIENYAIVLTISSNGLGLSELAAERARGSVDSHNRKRNLDLMVFHRILDIHRARVESQQERGALTRLRILLPEWDNDK